MVGAAPTDRVLEGICEVGSLEARETRGGEKGARTATQRDTWGTILRQEELDEV